MLSVWHVGKNLERENTMPTNIIMSLYRDLFHKGHTLYTDNWYTSLKLAKKLMNKNTHSVRTLRSNRRGNSQQVNVMKSRWHQSLEFLTLLNATSLKTDSISAQIVTNRNLNPKQKRAGKVEDVELALLGFFKKVRLKSFVQESKKIHANCGC